MRKNYLKSFKLDKNENEELEKLIKHYDAKNCSAAIRRAIKEALKKCLKL